MSRGQIERVLESLVKLDLVEKLEDDGVALPARRRRVYWRIKAVA
jgi:hypothetical protein